MDDGPRAGARRSSADRSATRSAGPRPGARQPAPTDARDPSGPRLRRRSRRPGPGPPPEPPPVHEAVLRFPLPPAKPRHPEPEEPAVATDHGERAGRNCSGRRPGARLGPFGPVRAGVSRGVGRASRGPHRGTVVSAGRRDPRLDDSRTAGGRLVRNRFAYRRVVRRPGRPVPVPVLERHHVDRPGRGQQRAVGRAAAVGAAEYGCDGAARPGSCERILPRAGSRRASTERARSGRSARSSSWCSPSAISCSR